MKPQIQLTGFKEARTALRKLYPELVPELRTELKQAVMLTTVPRARSLIEADKPATVRPRRSTGRAARSVRATSGGNVVFIVGGGARVPYFGWRDFGGDLKPVGQRHNKQSRPFMQRGRYLYRAVDDTSVALTRAAGSAFDRAARKAGWNGS